MIQGWLNPTPSPEKLLKAYVSTGETKYIKLLFEQFNAPLFHYLLSQSTKETAEDVLQTTWLNVMRSDSCDHINVKSWLYTIARHNLIDELRRQNRWQQVSIGEKHLDETMRTMRLEQDHENKSRLELFNFAVDRLPFHQRESFIFQQEGFSVNEICQLTNANFETVKSRLRYARQFIKKVMESFQ